MSDSIKRVLFIGNRHQVLQAIIDHPQLDLVRIMATSDSKQRFENAQSTSLSPLWFEESDKSEIIDAIDGSNFDVLVSNGCPILLPVSSLRKPNQLFLNVHPSLLPNNRGRHPANGVLLHDDERAGATLHYMDDRADTGNIIFQKSFPVSNDLDLGLVYHLLFRTEAKVFVEGINRLIGHDWKYPGEEQPKKGSYYTRKQSDTVLNFETMTTDEIVTRVRAFGHNGQGCGATIDGRHLQIYDADALTHSELLAEFKDAPPASIVLEYDNKLIIRTLQGLLRVRTYRETNES